MSKDKTANAASVAATPSSHTAEAFTSTQAAQDTVDFIEIDEILTLRRMVVRAPAPKAPCFSCMGFRKR